MEVEDDSKKKEDAAIMEDSENGKRAASHTVPLTVSSMAFLSSPIQNNGVLEGLCQIVHHTLLAAQHYLRDQPLQVTPWHVIPCTNTSEELLTGFSHAYGKHLLLYSGKQAPIFLDSKDNMGSWASDYDNHVVGRISLFHASQQELTSSQLMNHDENLGDMPPIIFLGAKVEYRSPPPSGNVQARKAEELSMHSMGDGSTDDSVKYGALASLHDVVLSYQLRIHSVRGKSYTFSSTPEDGLAQVTIAEVPQTNVTRLHLFASQTRELQCELSDLPPFSFPSRDLQEEFLVFQQVESATALPSHQTLLLNESAKPFISGRVYSSKDMPPSVFGWNLQNIPTVEQEDAIKREYATMWQEVLIDARLQHLDIASMLLNRLMYGRDMPEESVDVECLESLVMASTVYDPVGICAKALATRFAVEFGKAAMPCCAHEVEWLELRMGHRTPVVVPQRVINVLRRGGYFDVQRETNIAWFTEEAVRGPKDGNETVVVEEAIALLRDAGCEVAPQIKFVRVAATEPVKNRYMCRYNDDLMQYYVNDVVWTLEKPAVAIAMYVAQEHADGRILLNLKSPWR